MSTFHKKQYQEIANLINTMHSTAVNENEEWIVEELIQTFIEYFRVDNSEFKPEKFREWCHRGSDTQN